MSRENLWKPAPAQSSSASGTAARAIGRTVSARRLARISGGWGAQGPGRPPRALSRGGRGPGRPRGWRPVLTETVPENGRGLRHGGRGSGPRPARWTPAYRRRVALLIRGLERPRRSSYAEGEAAPAHRPRRRALVAVQVDPALLGSRGAQSRGASSPLRAERRAGEARHQTAPAGRPIEQWRLSCTPRARTSRPKGIGPLLAVEPSRRP